MMLQKMREDHVFEHLGRRNCPCGEKTFCQQRMGLRSLATAGWGFALLQAGGRLLAPRAHLSLVWAWSWRVSEASILF